MLPELGKQAPAFSALDENGNTITLNDFAGKKLVLYFTQRMTLQVALLRLVA